MESLQIGLLILAACMCCGAFLDLRTRQLPNWLSAVTAVAGLAYAAILGWDSILIWHVASFALALVVGMGLFALKMWGGGDGKFFAASAAWLPLGRMPELVLAISLAGLVLVLAWFVHVAISRKKLMGSRLPMIPYGIAIAIGTLAVFAMPLLWSDRAASPLVF